MRVLTSNRKVTCSGAPTGGVASGSGAFTDSTPSPSSAWEASQTHTFTAQTSSSGSGTGYVAASISTDGSGNPTFKYAANGGVGYAIGDTITFTDPGSTSNTAVLTVNELADSNVDILFDNETASATNYTTGGYFHSGSVYSWVMPNATSVYEFLLCRTSPITSEADKKVKFYRGFGSPLSISAI